MLAERNMDAYNACNTSIGKMKEDANRIKALAAYVEGWSVFK